MEKIRQINQQSLNAGNRTAVAQMTSFWGLMRAYWVSDRWKEAWALTLAIFIFTAFISKTTVWVAEASGSLMNSIVNVKSAPVQSPLMAIALNAGVLILLMLGKDVLLVGFRHLLSTTLHRKWRKWLNDSFSDAMLDGNHTHFHLQQGKGANLPDNVDQRLQESIKGMTGGAIGLVMGIVGVVLSAFFIGQKLLEISTEVSGLEFLGTYGGAVVAFAAIIVYVPVGTLIAIKIGRKLEQLNLGIQKAEGSYRGEWTTLLRRSFQISASEGEAVQSTVNKRLYKDVDGTWNRLNRFDAAYLAFSQAYGFLSNRIIAYIPGLIPYNAELQASGYYSLFVDTVPDDVKRLYTESAAKDFAALTQTAHRLKGVFAMLNLVPGKQLCETLEHLIREKDASGTEKYISDIDAYVKSLL